MRDVSSALAARFGLEKDRSYLETGELALQAGHSPGAVRSTIVEIYKTKEIAAVVGHLTKIRWNGVISTSLDMAFEDRLRQECDRHPVRHEICVLSEPVDSIPPRSVPVFKLLGSLDRDNFVCSQADYFQRRATWRGAIRMFVDMVRDAPVICLGMADSPDVLTDLLVELIGNPIPPPKYLLLLTDDPLATNQTLVRLVASKIRIVTVNASLAQLVGTVASAQLSASTTPVASQIGEPDLQSMSRYSSLAAVVNQHLTTDIQQQEQQRLQELLFSPAAARWDPYVYNMDFMRTAGTTLFDSMQSYVTMIQPETRYSAAIVTGSVASGKTVLLKRVAFALAQAGTLVVWLKPSYFQNSHVELNEMFKAVYRLKDYSRPVVVFMDDPLGFGGGITPRSVVAAAKRAGVGLLLCVGVRTTERLTRDPDDLSAALPVISDVDIPDSLDEGEWDRFAPYLVRLSIEPNIEAASQRMAAVESKAARDTLSMLYWLLPGTKAMITSAIRDELFRLGDMAGLTRVLIGEVNHTSAMLRDAYEMVTVSDYLGAALPVEVLVSALKVGYGDWLEVANSKGPVWGFLYSDKSDDETTIVYRPRNSVVTSVLIGAINAGSFSHSGEYRVMKRLLSGCTGTQLVYRDYCVRVLVRSKKIEQFSYEDGLSLFETALGALPFAERTLLHHKGLWIKNAGGDPIGAERVLRQALDARRYPYVTQDEVDEHIYTSLAATTLDAITQGKLSLEDGKHVVLDYLTKAKVGQWFNYKAVHVQAGLTVRLAAGLPEEFRADMYALINQAVADIDRTLLLLANPLEDRLYVEEAIHMLTDMRRKVLDNIGTLEELREDAMKRWNGHQRQDGFAVVARKLYERARETNKGTDFKEAWQYCEDSIALVRAAGNDPIVGLTDAILHIYYHWRVQRTVMHGSGAVLDWEAVRSWAVAVLRSGEPSAPFYVYLEALALAHLGRWADSNALFSHLRAADGVPNDLLWTFRDFLLNDGGGRKKVQGTIRKGASRLFLHVESIGSDFRVDRNAYWPEVGEIAHAYIMFSFAGPTAMQA
jgi:hypothetical protein